MSKSRSVSVGKTSKRRADKENILKKLRNFENPHPRIPGKTVFILGAGFSAPMGMPVMSRFISEGLAALKKAAWHDYKVDEKAIKKRAWATSEWLRDELKKITFPARKKTRNRTNGSAVKRLALPKAFVELQNEVNRLIESRIGLASKTLIDQIRSLKVRLPNTGRIGKDAAEALKRIQNSLIARVKRVKAEKECMAGGKKSVKHRRDLIEAVENLLVQYLPIFSGREKEEPSLEDVYCVVDIFAGDADRAILCMFIREVFYLAWEEHKEKLEHVRGHNSDSHHLVPTVSQSCFHNDARSKTAAAGVSPLPCESLPRNKSEVCIYRAFLSHFFSSKVTAPKECGQTAPDYVNSAIISLNYDLLIENKIRDFNRNDAEAAECVARIFYGRGVLDPKCDHENFAREDALMIPGEEAKRNAGKNRNPVVIPLIKLHGSLNWKFNGRGKSLKPSKQVHLIRDLDGRVQSSNKCLIYPTWQRDPLRDTVFSTLCMEARTHLRLASRIVIIGYSLPDTDRYLNYLFADIVNTPEMPEIVICNRGDADEWKMRAHKIFGDRLSANKLKVIDGLEEYVRSVEDPGAPRIDWDSPNL